MTGTETGTRDASRRRLLDALGHREPDRPPFDLGGTMMTGIHIDAYRILRTRLGLPQRQDPELFEPSVRHVFFEEDLYAAFPAEIDTRPALPDWSAGFPRTVVDEGERYTYTDEWGYGMAMPKDSPFYFSLYRHPLAEASTIDEIEGFPLPDPLDPARYQRMEGQIRRGEELGKAVVCNNIAAGTMEVATWLRGMDHFLVDFAFEDPKALRLLDRIADVKIAYWEEIHRRFGTRIDVVLESDDLGTQTSMLVSPQSYRRILKPRHRRILQAIRRLWGEEVKVLFHSCGSLRPVIPDLIEIGVDALNPLQFSAAQMDTAGLKHEFGRELTFWGGAADTQGTLCCAGPQQVKDEVRRQCEILAEGGGFVCAPVHNLQADVPPENILALAEAYLDLFGGA